MKIAVEAFSSQDLTSRRFFVFGFCRFDSEIGNAKLAFELGQFVEIDRPDDVDDRELLLVGVQHCQTANLFTIHQQINFEISFLFARDVYQPRPSWTTKLCANRFKIRSGVLPIGIKLKTLDVDAL